MGEIDVTEVTAIEYLEKLIKIDNERSCDWSHIKNGNYRIFLGLCKVGRGRQ